MKSSEEKVLRVFFDNPTERFHIREIARKTKLNPNTVLNILGILVRANLLQREKKLNVVEVFVTRTKKFIELKRIDNIKRIYESGVLDFLKTEFSPESISVIGSYSRGEDIGDSDVDFVLITKKDYKNLDLNKFEKELNKKIHLIVVDYNKISEEFYINLINGVILQGYLNKK